MKHIILSAILLTNIGTAAAFEARPAEEAKEPSLSTKCDVCPKKTASACGNCQAFFYCSPEHQTSAWPVHKHICKQLSPHKAKIAANSVEIQPSKLEGAGNGLFARRNIKDNDIVAIYYGQFRDEILNFKSYNSPYNYRMKNGALLQGDSAPHKSAFLAGPLVNDPYMEQQWIDDLMTVDCSNFDTAKIKRVADGYLKNHYSPRAARQNIELSELPQHKIGDFPAFVATRSISKGEEIYWPYGLNYWMSIPESICIQKGFPTVSLDIKQIVIDSVSGLSKKHKYLKELYMPSVEGLDLAGNRVTFLSEQHRIPLQLSSLLRDLNKIQLEVINEDEFKYILAQLEVESALKSIAELPNAQFYDHIRGVIVHPAAKELILKMIKFQSQQKIDAFVFVDMVKQAYFSMAEMDRMLTE